MQKPVSLSIGRFTESVQAAVKSAIAKHPKFKLDLPNEISVSYLIRGIPVPEAIAANVTLAETQTFATEIASQLTSAHPEAFGAERGLRAGAIYSIGGHLIIGIPVPPEVLLIEK